MKAEALYILAILIATTVTFVISLPMYAKDYLSTPKLLNDCSSEDGGTNCATVDGDTNGKGNSISLQINQSSQVNTSGHLDQPLLSASLVSGSADFSIPP
jgi:hypothetical protein